MASRDPKKLVPELYSLYLTFAEKMKEVGQDFILTCTTRTQADQDKLWNQGRTTKGPVVTWTRKSKHIEGKAFDIAIIKDGKISWDKDDYLIAAKIGQEVGLSAGAFWARNKDYPHFELKA